VAAKVEPLTLQQVVAKNVRRLRQEKKLRQEDVATAARRSGLRWTGVTVTQLESGNRSITVEEFVLLPMMLRCSLKDLVAHDELIQISEGSLLPAPTIASLVSEPVQPGDLQPEIPWIPALETTLDKRIKDAVWRAHLYPSLLSYLLVREASSGEAERKAAITLKAMTPAEVVAYSLRCWGRSLTHERDALAKKEEKAGKDPRAVRGHITRTLLECIKKERLAANERRRNESHMHLEALSHPDRNLNRILIEDYEKDERIRRRAQNLYEEWMLFQMLAEGEGEIPQRRNQQPRQPMSDAVRAKVRPKR
jgi:transcriptional regulator with XRE-family HTH domain